LPGDGRVGSLADPTRPRPHLPRGGPSWTPPEPTGTVGGRSKSQSLDAKLEQRLAGLQRSSRSSSPVSRGKLETRLAKATAELSAQVDNIRRSFTFFMGVVVTVFLARLV
jgi:hypothetical protein